MAEKAGRFFAGVLTLIFGGLMLTALANGTTGGVVVMAVFFLVCLWATFS